MRQQAFGEQANEFTKKHLYVCIFRGHVNLENAVLNNVKWVTSLQDF